MREDDRTGNVVPLDRRAIVWSRCPQIAIGVGGLVLRFVITLDLDPVGRTRAWQSPEGGLLLAIIAGVGIGEATWVLWRGLTASALVERVGDRVEVWTPHRTWSCERSHIVGLTEVHSTAGLVDEVDDVLIMTTHGSSVRVSSWWTTWAMYEVRSAIERMRQP